ncbi:MAG TPA: EF-hand domain-containing protein [Polyangiaceae bacterium]|nr:EF-hand domain-containing protein [Polyangiaceae bacterium]
MSDDSSLRAAFERFDSDANGYIDEAEFGALAQALGATLSPAQVAVAFLAMDVNGNRRVEYGEFRAWWTQHHPSRG